MLKYKEKGERDCVVWNIDVKIGYGKRNYGTSITSTEVIRKAMDTKSYIKNKKIVF
ncbi:MAG: hypothetical protein LBU29_02240 [Endomicrobium sp.]|nr:hypothetical protein [Endomicrobium sp.]